MILIISAEMSIPGKLFRRLCKASGRLKAQEKGRLSPQLTITSQRQDSCFGISGKSLGPTGLIFFYYNYFKGTILPKKLLT